MSKREKLSRDGIVQAAIALIEEEGEKAFTMRRLAGRLGVDPMAIYHHHKSKTALLDEMVQWLIESCDIPHSTDDWRQDIRNLCSSIRALAQKNPQLFGLYELYENWVPAEYQIHEAFLAALLRGGFSDEEAVWASRQLIAFVEAFAVDEVAGWMEPHDVEELKTDLADGPFPAMNQLLDKFAVRQPNEEFEFCLDVLLHGFEAQKSGS